VNGQGGLARANGRSGLWTANDVSPGGQIITFTVLLEAAYHVLSSSVTCFSGGTTIGSRILFSLPSSLSFY